MSLTGLYCAAKAQSDNLQRFVACFHSLELIFAIDFIDFSLSKVLAPNSDFWWAQSNIDPDKSTPQGLCNNSKLNFENKSIMSLEALKRILMYKNRIKSSIIDWFWSIIDWLIDLSTQSAKNR